MATLYLTQYFEVVVDGVKVAGGSRSTPEEITVTGAVKDATKVLATLTAWDFWITGADEPLTDFDFFYISSDVDVYVELVCDTGNNVGREDFAIEIRAGVPFILTKDEALALHTVDFAGTETEDVIDAIRVRNVSGGNATVRCVLVT